MAALQDNIDAIRKALENDALMVQYQPILNLKIPAMACYAIQIHIEGPDHQLLSERDLHRHSIDTGMQHDIDRWAVKNALKDLEILRKSSPLARIFINISGAGITDPDFPNWISRQLKLSGMVGAGLVLCVRISDLASNLKIAYRSIRRLQKINVETCITRFPEKPQAFELLKFLKAEYIKISPRLLKADKSTIDTMVENARKLKSKIILSDVDDAESVDLRWATGADFLQGKYIHGLMDDMSFDFEQHQAPMNPVS